MRGLIILVLCVLLPVGYSKESYLLKPSQLTGKMNTGEVFGVQPGANSVPNPFSSTIIFDKSTIAGYVDTFCLGVLIALHFVLTDFTCSVEMTIRLPSGEPKLIGFQLTKAWIGAFDGLQNSYYSYISGTHEDHPNNLAVAVLETAAVPSQFVSLAYIPRTIDHDDLCGQTAVKPVYNVQGCKLEPLNVKISQTGSVSIKATSEHENYYVFSVGGPLFYYNKLIGIYGKFYYATGIIGDDRYKNISNHMDFINKYSLILDYNMYIHDPVFSGQQ